MFGNVGSVISFRVGNDDAELLEEVLAPDVPAARLLNLGRHQIYARIQEDGLPGVPFEGKTLRPELGMYRQREAILKASRAHYARPRTSVEAKIARFLTRKNPP